jgi:hypothetical protein
MRLSADECRLRFAAARVARLATTGADMCPHLVPVTFAVSGDLLVVGIMLEKGSSSAITAPAGWTLIRRTDQGTNAGMGTYYKWAGASEPASYTWNVIPDTVPPETTLDEFLRRKVDRTRPVVNQAVRCGPLALRIRSIGEDGEIDMVGMTVLSEQDIARFERDSHQNKKQQAVGPIKPPAPPDPSQSA